ncbi:hypothetical protein Gogos_008660 [Gossypium gossypioides]|uniref:Protein kinase domain-containing protein n=1 Tax=Gossypium gossypioides TaxID=34282 RepID=A0A7J9CCC9_GOSGO|nr:hypothetical protein [Gossypium gossypioides]
MSINMKTLTQAFAKTAAVIEKTVQTTVQEVSGPKALLDYELLHQIGSAGPGLAWKLYSAKARDATRPHQYPTDSFFDLIRADAARLVRLRHPGVVHVVQALDENKNAMTMVTEPLFASVANAIGNVENVAKVPKDLKGIEMSLLEVKHGLLQIAESLEFLHTNARLIHRALSPENVLITSSGAWKLGGFGFAISTDQASSDFVKAFHYSEYDTEDSVMPLQPSLNYTAPELVRSKSSSVGWSSDIFSYGCLAYHLVARKPLFDCNNNVKMYMNTLTYLSSEAFSSIPPELIYDLQRMLSANESTRPSALDFTGSPFFQDDTRLRALRFLDHMLERDNMQKSEFLKALSDMWKDFDSRVLQYKVLPPLCAELRNLVMQPMIVPMVLKIAESQGKTDFELVTFPALVPVMSTAAGETLLLLVKHADLIINKTTSEHRVSHVMPMLVRAYDDGDPRIQEEALRKSLFLAKQLDMQVRVNALLCLADFVQTLNKHAVLEVLQTIRRCTAVDLSAPTLMCTLAVSSSILKQYGVEFAAEHVLPLLTPLLTAQQLNIQQFAKYMHFVKDILSKIEEKRGVTLTGSGIPEVKHATAANGLQSQALSKTSATVSCAANAKSSPSWDEDWGPTARRAANAGASVSATVQQASQNNSSINPILGDKSIQSAPIQTEPSVISTVSSQQMPVSCAAVDIEWPPRAPLGVTAESGNVEKQFNAGTSSPSNFDDLDPFSNWPPQPSASNGFGTFNNGTMGPVTNNYGSNSITSTFPESKSNSWAFSNQNSGELLRPNPVDSTPNASILNSGGFQNSIGFLKQNQGNSVSMSSSYNNQKSLDLGSIFSTSKNEQAAPKLAPPPSAAVGRGRGMGRARVTHAKSSSQQPPILDLL